MADDTDTAAELVSGGCEVRKSSVRRGAGSGVEVRVRAVRRRSWSTEDKLRIVRETLEPGAVATAVADRHGISTGLLFTWRKQMLATAMSGKRQRIPAGGGWWVRRRRLMRCFW
jgi:transposase